VRITRSGYMRSFLLTFRTLFYPALVFTFVDRRHGETVVDEEEVSGESTPLLRG